MDFINKIIEIMNKKGITAYKLCKETGLSQQSFSNWKLGKTPSIDKAIKVIKYLEISADDLFEIKTDKINLNEPQKEMISIMEDMEEREQWKAVGIIENYSQNIKSEVEDESDKSSISKIS